MASSHIAYPQNYFQKPLQNFFWVGLSLYEIKNSNSRMLHYIWFIIVNTIGYFYYFTEYVHMFMHFDQMEELTLTFCYIFSHTMAIGKLLVLVIKRKQIAKILNLLESSVFLPNIERGGPMEIEIVSNAISLTNTQLNIFGGIVVIMVTTGVFPYLSNGRVTYQVSPNITKVVARFPYPSTLPFEVDTTASPYYELLFVFQVFSMSLFGWYLGNSDALNTGLMIHITAQFKILINAIATAVERAERMTAYGRPDGKEEKYIKYKMKNNRSILIEKVDIYNAKIMANLKICVNECIYHHQNIINLVGYIEDNLNGLILIQFLCCLFTIVVGLYQISLVPVNSPLFTSMSSFSLAITFEVFIHCLYGNEMSICSTEVATAAYNFDWIKADDGIRKGILLMMLRAQRECYLTFGKFSKITLATFLTIIRGAFSYFTVLRTMSEDT